MQRGPGHGGKQRGSIYNKPGVSTHRQRDQQTEQRGIGQPSHDYQNPRKRPHSPLSVTTTPLDDEFDEIGSAALFDYEMSQHQGADQPTAQQHGHEPHPPTPVHQSSDILPPPAILHYNPYTSTSSSSGSTSTSSGNEQLSASVHDPTHSTPNVGASVTQMQSGFHDNQQRITQLENERYRYLGEVKTLRDRMSHIDQEFHSLKEAHKLESASKEKEWERRLEQQSRIVEQQSRRLEQLSTQLEFTQKELIDERDKRKASEDKLSHLGRGSTAEPVMRVPMQVAKVKRPQQQYSPPSGPLAVFPSTASFMESPRFVASTPLQRKRPQEMHPALPNVDSKSGVQLTTEAQSVTPNPSPLLGARVADKSVQTPSQSSSGLFSVSTTSSVQVTLGRSFIAPHSEGDAFLVNTVQSDGRFSGPELLQRLVQWDGQENKPAMDGSIDNQNKVVLLPEEDMLSPSMEEEVEDVEKGDTHGVPPVQSEGFFSILTCLNPFFIACTSKPIDALVSPQHSSSSSSKKRKAAVKENTSLAKAAILQSIGRKRRLVASEDSESSSSEDSGPAKASPMGNMSPFLLDSASRCQLQECVSRLLASAGVPRTTSASAELCTPLQFAGHHDAHSLAQQRSEEDQGLSLLYFLQSRIIAYCQECTGESSHQGDSDSPLTTSSESTLDSLENSDRGPNTSSLSSEGGVVDFYTPLLQLLKILLVLVQYSPSVREKICERPPHLVYDSLIPSRPGSRSSGHTESHSESSSGSKDGSIELLSQKSSSDLSDQSSVRMDTSGEQSSSQHQQSQLGLVEANHPAPQDHVWMPHPSMNKVYIDISNHSATTPSSNQPSFLSSEQDVSVDVMHHASLTAQFFPLLLRLAGPPWSDNLPVCQCVLDILSHLVPACSPGHLHRLHTLLSDGAFLACLKHDSCNVACTVARIITSLVQTKGIAELLCSKKNTACLMYKLYMFLCDPPSDTSDTSLAELTSQVLRLMCAVISHVEGGLNLIFYSDCDCTMEAPSAILHGVCHHLPIKNGAEVPQPVITSFQELVSFLDCYTFPDNEEDYIFVIESLLEFFSGFGMKYKREVAALQCLQQELEHHGDNEGEEEEEGMDTQSL